MRAVLDTNVIVSALLAPTGSPAGLLRAWTEGAFDLVASPMLFDELERVLAYPKLRRHVTTDEAADVVGWLRREAILLPDPADPPAIRSVDEADDYLIALAATASAFLVTGDSDLLDLAGRIPVLAPAAFLELLGTDGG